jgi:DNA polymerase III subunit delta
MVHIHKSVPVKFQQLSSFEKHLEKAAPDHLSRVYLVAAPCSFERKKICDKICAQIEKKEKKIALLRFEGAEMWARASEELSMIVSIGAHRVVVFDDADKLKKAALEALASYVARPSPYVYLLLSAASAKPFSDIYEQGKKELVVCDLCAEKPWERKERLKAHLVRMAAQEKKTLLREAADLLLERVGNELSQLEQEITKLICYCADRREISAADVNTLCHTEKMASIWQLAEALVWQEKPVKVETSFELSSFLPLLSQVRLHLQQGKVLALYQNQVALASFKPQLLEKIAPIARMRKCAFFTEALHVVFSMEMLAKQSALSASLLADLLIAKIDMLKKQYALSSS